MKVNTIVPSTLKKMSSEDLVYYTMQNNVVLFSSIDEFRHWVFTLNFDLLSEYIEYCVNGHNAMHVDVWFKFPFITQIRNQVVSNPEFEIQPRALTLDFTTPPDDIFITMIRKRCKKV